MTSTDLMQRTTVMMALLVPSGLAFGGAVIAADDAVKITEPPAMDSQSPMVNKAETAESAL